MESENSSFKKSIFDPPVDQTLTDVLVRFIKNETSRFGVKKCVVGLSGGIDSSVAASLAQKALNPNNLFGLLLPYKTSSKDSISDALTIAQILKIKTEIIDISDAVDALADKLKITDKVRKGNVIARIRMTALFDYSMKIGGMVLGTGNKTEMLLGYTTIYGDSASAINPLGDLYKTQVWQLAEILNIPKNIIRKKPSADLWIGQSDEGELGFTYDEVDRLLFYMVNCKYSDKELIEAGFKFNFIKKVKKIIRKNQFKRMPPVIAKVSNRTINTDFRYNRDWGT